MLLGFKAAGRVPAALGIVVAVVAAFAWGDGWNAGAEWPHHGGDLDAQRYSPLSQIDATNADELEIRWRWSAASYGPVPERKYIATPIMVGGRLYVTAGLRRAVAAIEPATGETLWTWRLDEGEARTASAPRRNSGRGVAYWRRADDERIFVITPGYQLVALAADTGRPVRRFGREGIVDLRRGLGRDVDVDHTRIGSSSPPLVVGDVLVVGAALDPGTRPRSRRHVAAPVRGFDARTGRELWRFHTIPGPGEPGQDTWEQESWRYTGNTGVWTTMSADAERGLVYLPVEAPTSDYYGGHRPGDNLFASSLVCLDVRTGKRVWHQQIVRHDIWDYDNPTAPILMDLTLADGRRVPAVAQLTKQAFTYVFDRVTGEPVWPLVERAVPQTDVPGERTAATQRFPTLPEPFDRQGFTERDLIDFTPSLTRQALTAVEGLRLGPLFTPASLADAPDGSRGTLVMPGSLGGANWEGGAYDPATQTLFVPSSTLPSVLALAKDPSSDVDYSGLGRVPRVDGLPLVKPPYGRITAIDMATGAHRWMVANADTPSEIAAHPALRDLDLPRTGIATRAMLLATQTLLFAGEGWGGSAILRALDKSTGETVAEISIPASVTGLPMTYRVDERQYVVFAVGDGETTAELVALTLPDTLVEPAESAE